MSANDDPEDFDHALLPEAVRISPDGKARYLLNHAAESNPRAARSGATLVGYAHSVGILRPPEVSEERWLELACEVAGGE